MLIGMLFRSMLVVLGGVKRMEVHSSLSDAVLHEKPQIKAPR
jgi:hypothetical protein